MTVHRAIAAKIKRLKAHESTDNALRLLNTAFLRSSTAMDLTLKPNHCLYSRIGNPDSDPNDCFLHNHAFPLFAIGCDRVRLNSLHH